MMCALFLNGRVYARGAYSSCYAAASRLDLMRDVATSNGTVSRPIPGAMISPCDAPGPMLAGDGLTLAGGAPLPPMPMPVTIDEVAA